MTRVAFIGLGNMGSGMSANQLKAGREVVAFDLSADAMADAHVDMVGIDDRGGKRIAADASAIEIMHQTFHPGEALAFGRWNFVPVMAETFERRGQHPALGSATLGQLLATWSAHDLNHLHQISRIMAHQVREATGPWQKYLGVMHCNGHGAPA